MDVTASPEAKLVIQLLLLAWMVLVALMDHRTGRIPNWLTGPVLLGVGAFRLVEGFMGAPVRFLLPVVWALIFLMWMLHFVGGGDAKFLMALYALFPSMEFTGVLALVLLVVMVPVLAWEWRGKSVRRLARGLRARLVTGQILPSAEELHSQGRRYAWTFAVPAMVYTLFYW